MSDNKKHKIKSLFDELEIKNNFNLYRKFMRGGSYSVVSDKPKKKPVTIENIIANKNNIAVLSRMMSKSAFNEVEFTNLSFRGITMIRTAFVFSDLRGSDFSKTILKRCDFSFANLQNCDFSDSVMIECIFRHADIKNAKFASADTYFCDFTHAEF